MAVDWMDDAMVLRLAVEDGDIFVNTEPALFIGMLITELDLGDTYE